MSPKTVLFVRTMAIRFPNLGPLLEDHCEANFGEILPHVFFGDVTRHVMSAFLETGSSSRRELGEVVQYLEEAFANGDDEIQELIAVSFLENLPRKGEQGGDVRKLIGPNLKRQLKAFG